MKRVFHPKANTFEDVPDGDVEKWAEAGWLKNQPKHVTLPDGTHKPGEHPGFATIPVLEDTSRTQSPSGVSAATVGSGKPAKKAAAKKVAAPKSVPSGTPAGAGK